MGSSPLANALPTTRPGPVELDRNGLEILGPAESIRLLGSATLGRVAVTIGALPCILPVNFRMIDGAVVFRTGRGSKLDAATANAVVAFEADDMDPVEHTGWSVVVTGVARDVTDDVPGANDAGAIPRWAPGPGGRVVMIVPHLISGRRLVHVPS